ncbi:hypothetical protein EUGRSUZ_H00662 [Eucalyptus grandis]|uniref:Uncharacterized protein n=2 Tax=Eucalyptus grandis TaxID=71139 RepID=A0ACC3JMF0_EUCGR|nr:hypothetical protein EUGRSUZ_H00662 [Eucalyptus grandis]
MADQRKIHPVADLDLPSTVPLDHPVIVPSRPPRTRSCFYRCWCWIICLLVVLLLVVLATAAILYAIFQSKLLKCSIQKLGITKLRLNIDLTLYAKFKVQIKASNPNKRIGIYYDKGSLPIFYQGHKNFTELNVGLSGKTRSGSTLMNALQEQQQRGRIPLSLNVDAPVTVKVGRLKLRKVRILGKCLFVVDSLSTNNLVSIKADDFTTSDL